MFEEWVAKGINVEIRYKYFFNPRVTKWVANVSRRGYNGRSIELEDYKDSWGEAYKDAEKQIKLLR